MFLGIALPWADGLSAAPALRRNILLIIADDLRPDLGCFGNLQAQTPNIDQLAKRGVVFERAFCPQALCAPSRASLMTGARPDTMKVWDVWTHFRAAMPNVVTLPQLLRTQGWFTQAIGKVYHTNLNDEPSWSVPHVMPPDPLYGTAEVKALLAAKRKRAEMDGLTGVMLARAIRSGPPAEAPEVPDDELVDGKIATLAVSALRETKARSQPFFLAVGFTKPHLPFVAPRKYWDLFDRTQIQLSTFREPPMGAPGYALGDSGELLGYDNVPRPQSMPRDYEKWLRHAYLAATSFMDAQVGRVLVELERLGLNDSTIVIFLGDNGYKLGDYAAWTKTTNALLDTRIPLIFQGPGIPANQRARGMVEVVDIYPTVLELLDLPPQSGMEGISFAPLLKRPRAQWKDAVFTQSPQLDGTQPLMGYSVITERYRLTRWMTRDSMMKEVGLELYDHEKDPGETRNVRLEPDYRKTAEQLLLQLSQGWRASQVPAD